MDATKLISLYSNLFYVSLALCLLGLALAIAFFFLFDIPMVFSQMTGRGKERALKRMRQQSKDPAKPPSGSLSSGELYTGSLTGDTAKGKAPVREVPSPQESPPTAETAVLQDTAPPAESHLGQTAYLNPEAAPPPPSIGRFEVFETILWVHTDEVI